MEYKSPRSAACSFPPFAPKSSVAISLAALARIFVPSTKAWIKGSRGAIALTIPSQTESGVACLTFIPRCSHAFATAAAVATSSLLSTATPTGARMLRVCSNGCSLLGGAGSSIAPLSTAKDSRRAPKNPSR